MSLYLEAWKHLTPFVCITYRSVLPSANVFTAKVSSSYSIRSTRGGYVTILLAVGCLFFIWIQLAEYLGGVEDHQFTVDKNVGKDMQINLDMTIAMHCDKMSANVLDKSMDRLIASELLEFQKVSTTWGVFERTVLISFIDGFPASVEALRSDQTWRLKPPKRNSTRCSTSCKTSAPFFKTERSSKRPGLSDIWIVPSNQGARWFSYYFERILFKKFPKGQSVYVILSERLLKSARRG